MRVWTKKRPRFEAVFAVNVDIIGVFGPVFDVLHKNQLKTKSAVSVDFKWLYVALCGLKWHFVAFYDVFFRKNIENWGNFPGFSYIDMYYLVWKLLSSGSGYMGVTSMF